MNHDESNTADQLDATGNTAGSPLYSADAVAAFPREAVDDSIPKRFETVAKKYPHQFALESTEGGVTYDQLNRHANRIARVIIKTDVDRVGLCFGHHVHAIAAMLGVLKTGKAYVPLDSSYPRSRIRFMIENAGIKVILTDNANLQSAREYAGNDVDVLSIDAMAAGIHDANLNNPIPPDQIAYVIYTSGSTGEPKGVIQTHRNLLHFARCYSTNLGITANDRLTMLFSFSFSAANMDIYPSLLTGATGVLYDLRYEGIDRLAQWLIDQRISVFHSIPTVLRQFLHALPENAFPPDLRAIDVAGEPLNRADVMLFQRRTHCDCVLVNHLACTEASVCALLFVDANADFPDGPAPVGRAVDGIEIQILDEELREVTRGAVGEIAIRSRFVSPGYWRLPDLTARSFLADSGDGNELTYRTGDLGRYRSDGVLVHVGRRDTRVILRGFTIEVSEIESVLVEQAEIAEAVVLADASADQDHRAQRLVGYITWSETRTLSLHELRERLMARLPSHMIPSRFMVIDHMPRLPNGKIDRRTLKSSSVGKRLVNTYVPPETELEVALCCLWESVLCVDRVGIEDNFFDLGGDSLRAVRLFVELERKFSRQYRLSSLLEAPTVKKLAAEMQRDTSWQSTGLVLLEAQGDKPPMFLVCGLGGTVFCFRELAALLATDQPIYGVPYPGFEDGTQPLDDIETIADELIARIQSVQPTGPYYLGGYSIGGLVAYEMARRLLACGQQVPFLALMDTRSPLTRRKLPLLQRLRIHIEFVRTLTSSDRMKYVKDRLRRLVYRVRRKSSNDDHLTKSVDGSLTDRIGTVRMAAERAMNQYSPQPYTGKITLFRCDATPDWFAFNRIDPLLGWGALATERIDVEPIPGQHLEMFDPGVVEVLADRMRNRLQQCTCQITTEVE